jgi:hypothetical protein
MMQQLQERRVVAQVDSNGRESSVRNAQGYLSQAINDAETLYVELSKRLDPLLRPEGPVAGESMDKVRPSEGCHLADEIKHAADRVSAIAGCLKGMIDRLEI